MWAVFHKCSMLFWGPIFSEFWVPPNYGLKIWNGDVFCCLCISDRFLEGNLRCRLDYIEIFSRFFCCVSLIRLACVSEMLLKTIAIEARCLSASLSRRTVYSPFRCPWSPCLTARVSLGICWDSRWLRRCPMCWSSSSPRGRTAGHAGIGRACLGHLHTSQSAVKLT